MSDQRKKKVVSAAQAQALLLLEPFAIARAWFDQDGVMEGAPILDVASHGITQRDIQAYFDASEEPEDNGGNPYQGCEVTYLFHLHYQVAIGSHWELDDKPMTAGAPAHWEYEEVCVIKVEYLSTVPVFPE